MKPLERKFELPNFCILTFAERIRSVSALRQKLVKEEAVNQISVYTFFEYSKSPPNKLLNNFFFSWSSPLVALSTWSDLHSNHGYKPDMKLG